MNQIHEKYKVSEDMYEIKETMTEDAHTMNTNSAKFRKELEKNL